jgi:hypothetical protein
MISEATIDIETAKKELLSTALVRGTMLDNLLGLAEAQRRMLVDGKHLELAENIQAQDKSLSELALLDKEEEALLQSAPRELTSSTSEFLHRYTEISETAARIAEKLRAVVQTNRELLDSMMQYVAFSLGAISSAAADQQSYDQRFDTAGNSPAIVLDRKV